MKSSTLLPLLIVLIGCSGNQNRSNSELKTEYGPQEHLRPKPGLKIEYRPTRGQSYTDPLGTEYQLRHIPATITNDSESSIHVQIAFSKEYDYPIAYGDEQFKVFPMPKEWALEGVDITESTLNELPHFTDAPFLSMTLEPGEERLLAFGTLYPSTAQYGVFPVAVFSYDNRDLHHECDRLIDPNKLPIPRGALELLIGFTAGSQASPDRCTTIPFGQVSLPESIPKD